MEVLLRISSSSSTKAVLLKRECRLTSKKVHNSSELGFTEYRVVSEAACESWMFGDEDFHTEKDISVAGKLQSPLVSSFRRNVRGGIEEQQLEHLVALLDSVILADVPTRWVKNILIKVNIFAWKFALDRLPTRANLVQRNVTESQSCPLCDAILEDTSHLFFNCSLARDVTRLLCRWWNLGVQTFSSYAEWLVWFNSVRLASNLMVILEGVFYVTWWSLWNFRNQLLFASKKPRKESIFDDIVLRSFCWFKARGSSKLRWDSWIQHPYLISL
ncbi:RNA-directed DNA polymerase, eukaryota [Tanacetum coccineum]